MAGSQGREKRPWPSDGVWIMQVLGCLGAGLLVYFVVRALASDGAAIFLAILTAGLALLLVVNRYEGEWSSRRNPDPEDFVLTTRQRLLCLVVGAPCTGLAVLLGPSGLDPDHVVVVAASYVFAVIGFITLWGAIFGMYSGD